MKINCKIKLYTIYHFLYQISEKSMQQFKKRNSEHHISKVNFINKNENIVSFHMFLAHIFVRLVFWKVPVACFLWKSRQFKHHDLCRWSWANNIAQRLTFSKYFLTNPDVFICTFCRNSGALSVPSSGRIQTTTTKVSKISSLFLV